MKISRRLRAMAVAVAMGAAALGHAPASAQVQPAGVLPAETATSGTPHVLDGRVNSVARVGGTMLLGGSFSQARNHADTTVLSRTNLLAFDAGTRRISTTFVPQPNGQVHIVLPAGDGTVFVGGKFTTIGGQARKNLARIRVSDGAVLPFDAGKITGQVKDLALAGGRLWLGGQFTHIAGREQRALATVDPQTGAFLPYMGLRVEGTHAGGTTQVLKIDVAAGGARLAAVGNFATVDGQARRQLVQLDLSGESAAVDPFATRFFTSTCNSSFDAYVRDVGYSPDGSYFVVTTTGGYGGADSACDMSSRFETASTGDVAPSWVNYTGGDTLHGVEVTDSVVYVGGHFRWQNNPYGRDFASTGAVAREGIAALDPSNGLPFDWNPTRTRGVGVFDFLQDEQGLWLSSDTDRIGRDYKFQGRIALLDGRGTSFPAVQPATLPNDVYRVGTSTVTARSLREDGTTGAERAVQGLPASSVRGAFMINGYLYLAQSDGTFVRRSFDGSTFGAVERVDTANRISTITTWRDDLRAMTGMFYDNGRIYYTRTGSSQLHYRYFTAQSGIVGAKRLTASSSVSGVSFSSVRGMFYADGRLYWSDTGGTLRSIEWEQGPAAGAPRAGTARIVSAAQAGVSWSNRALFLYQDRAGLGAVMDPQAAFTVACESRTCTFDGSRSKAPGGQVTGFEWSFGDGGTATGEKVERTFTRDGRFDVTLTVRTSTGRSASQTQSVSVVRVNRPPTASFTASCDGLTCSFDAAGSSDADGPLSGFAWEFGDGRIGTGVRPTHTYQQEGPRTVRLTVTDADGASTSTTQSLAVSQAGVEWVAGVSANANTAQHRVRVPAQVREGDLLLLHVALNTDTTIEAPTGWAPVATTGHGGMSGATWSRHATSDDAGSLVAVTAGAVSKGDATVVAYRGVGGRRAVVAQGAGSIDDSTTTEHTSARVTAPSGGGWLVTYWASKASTEHTWLDLGGQFRRTGSAGVGGGRVTAVLTDSGAMVEAGLRGGLRGTTSDGVARALSFSTVVGLE